MGKIFFLVLSLVFSIYSNSQTIEKKYSDFELVVTVKNVSEFDLSGVSNNVNIDFDKIDKLLLNAYTTKKTAAYSFNSDGYIIEKNSYSTDAKTIYQSIYNYDSSNLLTEVREKDNPSDNLNNTEFDIIKISRNGNEVTKTWNYATNDTIYSEKYILENNYIVTEKLPNSEKLRVKYIYDKNHNKLKGVITLDSGEQLTWRNSFAFYPNGVLKSKECLWSDLKTKTKETYFPNGLIKSKTSKNEILNFDYKYDNQGNWIYKIVFKNKKTIKLLKREINYF